MLRQSGICLRMYNQQHMKYNKEKVKLPKSDLIDGLLGFVFFFFNSATKRKKLSSYKGNFPSQKTNK